MTLEQFFEAESNVQDLRLEYLSHEEGEEDEEAIPEPISEPSKNTQDKQGTSQTANPDDTANHIADDIFYG